MEPTGHEEEIKMGISTKKEDGMLDGKMIARILLIYCWFGGQFF